MVTLTPSRARGIWPATKSEPCQTRVSGARLVPLMATQVLGAIDAAPLAALLAEVMAGAGPVPFGGATAMAAVACLRGVAKVVAVTVTLAGAESDGGGV